YCARFPSYYYGSSYGAY
nr:immunoglobulin heavy chain junction region [Mus musculus]